MTVIKSNVDTIRPYVVCAILRDVTFDDARYHSFLELQDQLHRNLCRNRTLVAIGTHDLDAVQGPFVYDACPPKDIRFVPLTHVAEEREFAGDALLEHYATEPACKHLKPYVPIIRDAPLYPVVLDSEGTVLSLPPIINGSKSRITLDTKNVFIECTATNLTKANIVLDTVVAMFSEYAARPFTVEPVTVTYVDETGAATDSQVTPVMYARKETASVNMVNSLIGIDLPADKMAQLCNKVMLGPARILLAEGEEGPLLEVTPHPHPLRHPTRRRRRRGRGHGVRLQQHPEDAAEDPHGRQRPAPEHSRRPASGGDRAGGVHRGPDARPALRRPLAPAIRLSNPANVEYEMVRTSLLPGLLKCLQHNRAASVRGRVQALRGQRRGAAGRGARGDRHGGGGAERAAGVRHVLRADERLRDDPRTGGPPPVPV